VRAVGPQSIAWCWSLVKGDDPEDLALVKLANPLEQITVVTLQAKRDLPGWELSHWLKVVCNVPTRDQALRFLAEGDWDAANVGVDCPTIPEGVPIIVGADWGWADDATAYVPAWYGEDGMLLLGAATIVEPPRNGTDLTPQEALKRLAAIDAVNPISVIAHDETYGGKIMTGLLVERFPTADIIPVTKADADAAPLHFSEQLRGGKLKHTGDATLKRHLMNAIRVPIQDDPEHFRIKRLKESRHAPSQRALREIDAAVAAVNAVWGAVGREPTDEPFLKFL
jgi:phage terminase large subunit-like protein